MEKERRIKVLSLVALIVAVLGLTIAFAALSQTLTINGRASMGSSQWDVHFENLSNANITGDATEVSKPQITDGGITVNNMNVSLVKPKDKVEYTVEIVNDGSITAKVEKIQMTELTEEQSKYLEFYANYSDGRSVSESDILEPNQREVVKIVIGFKEDLTAEDLPKETTTIDLSLTIDYVQSDDKEEGDIPTTTTPVSKTYEVGEEISLGEEHFYVISDNGDTVTALAKYNLLVGNMYTSEFNGLIEETTEGYGIQNENATGAINYPYYVGTVAFSTTKYWSYSSSRPDLDYGKSYPAEVYDSNSNLYQYVQNYQKYLLNNGYMSTNARLLTMNEAIILGCSSNCSAAPEWLTSTWFWLSTAQEDSKIYFITKLKSFGSVNYYYHESRYFGIRPVITISKSEL